MKLLMYVSNDLVGSAPVDVKKIAVPGYLGKIKRKLAKKYNSSEALSASEPEFIVVRLTGIKTFASDQSTSELDSF